MTPNKCKYSDTIGKQVYIFVQKKQQSRTDFLEAPKTEEMMNKQAWGKTVEQPAYKQYTIAIEDPTWNCHQKKDTAIKLFKSISDPYWPCRKFCDVA